MKVALTGASGYVGSRIAECLRSQGLEVLSLSRKPCPEPWCSYSLGDDPSMLPWAGVDALIHAAYDFSPQTWEKSRIANINQSIALFDAAKAAGVGRMMFISSMSAFQGCRSHYGSAKLAVEEHLLKLCGQVIRPGLVWGNDPGGVMGSLDRIVKSLPIIPCLVGPGHLPQYLIHEDDLAQAVTAILTQSPPASGVHPIMHPEPVSMRHILRTLARRRHVRRVFFPLHWTLAMAAIRIAEAVGLKIPFRSDSLVGLVHGNSLPEILPAPQGVSYRSFQ